MGPSTPLHRPLKAMQGPGFFDDQRIERQGPALALANMGRAREGMQMITPASAWEGRGKGIGQWLLKIKMPFILRNRFHYIEIVHYSVEGLKKRLLIELLSKEKVRKLPRAHAPYFINQFPASTQIFLFAFAAIGQQTKMKTQVVIEFFCFGYDAIVRFLREIIGVHRYRIKMCRMCGPKKMAKKYPVSDLARSQDEAPTSSTGPHKHNTSASTYHPGWRS